MRISGKELKQWIDEAWPEPTTDNWYWDHDCFDGDPDPDETYDTEDLGPLLFQGDTRTLEVVPESIDLAKAIRRWRKTRNKVLCVYMVPKELVAALDVVMKHLGIQKV